MSVLQQEDPYFLDINTVEPQFNEGQRDWNHLFAKTRFGCIEIFSTGYILRSLRLGMSFVIPRSSLNRGSG